MRRLISLTSLFLIASCGGGGEDEVLYGPCYVGVDGPVFVITEAKNSVTAQAIPSLTLHTITYSGSPFFPPLGGFELQRAVISGESIQCTPTCGFTSMEGSYSFVASAPGYRSRTIELQATYGTYKGGCPGLYSDPTKVSITLDPEQ